MRMSCMHAVVAAFVLAAAAPCLAQDRLSLRQIVQAAEKNDPELLALREERGLREAQKIRVETLSNPVVELEGATGALTGSSDAATMSVSVSQEIPLWGKRAGRAKGAQLAVGEAEARIAERERLLAREIRERHAAYLLAASRVSLASQGAGLAKELRGLAEIRFREGDIPEYELNLAKGEEATALARVRGEERSRDAAKRELLSSAGIADDVPVAEEGATGAFTGGEPEAVASAVASRPEVAAARASRERYEAELHAAGREHLPDLTVGLSWQRETDAVEVDGRTFKGTDNLLGVRLSMPIPLFDRNRAGIREATARLQGADERLRLVRERAGREASAAYRGLQTARKLLELYERDVVPPAKENAVIMHEAYRLGETGIAQVLQEQRRLLDVMENLLLLQQEVRDAEAKLEYAAGLPADGGAR